MSEKLLTVIEMDGAREIEDILARGRAEASKLLDEAHRAGEKIAGGELPLRRLEVDSTALGEAKVRFLAEHGALLDRVKHKCSELADRLPDYVKSDIHLSAVLAGLAHLGPGDYKVELPAIAIPLGNGALPEGVFVEWLTADDETVTVRDGTGRTVGVFNLSSAIENYFRHRVEEIDEMVYANEL